MLSLPTDEVHIHLLKPGCCKASDLELLDHAEQQRAHLFKFSRDHDLYVSAHAFLRQVLSRYAPVSPQDWRFLANAYGKPAIADQEYQWLHFNLSHTQGMVACAVANQRQVGVDIEHGNRQIDVAILSQYVFSTLEAMDVLSAPSQEEQKRRFFNYWTLKEAYIKAKGMGLSMPLQQFSMTKTAKQTWQLIFAPGFQDPGEVWQFGAKRLGENYYLAYCVQKQHPGEALQKLKVSLVKVDSR
jgi:4'-phosphopantetheinyl transferase